MKGEATKQNGGCAHKADSRYNELSERVEFLREHVESMHELLQGLMDAQQRGLKQVTLYLDRHLGRTVRRG